MITISTFSNVRPKQGLSACKPSFNICFWFFAWLLVFWLGPSNTYLQAQTYSGPLVITKGGTYTGNWESRDSEVPAIEIRTNEAVVILNSNLRGAGALVRSLGNSADITIRHTNGYGITPSPWRDYMKPRRFLAVDVFRNIVVENCYMEGTAGIYIGQRYEGNGSTANTIKIRYNKAKNIDGRVYGGGKALVQFVQFNFKVGAPHVEVAWNEVINEAGNSAVEDNISIYNSRGTSASPIRIHNNFIQGAYPIPYNNTRYTGGGIITDGDGDINTCPAYITASDNQLVNLGNYSMGIAGGNNIRYTSNRAVNSALHKDGSKFAFYTSGLWSKDYYNKNTTFSNSVDNNTVGVTAWGYVNNRNDVSVAENASFTNNTFLPGGAIPVSMENDELNRWITKLQQNGIVLGPSSTGTNQAPSVTLTAPLSNASFTVGTTITMAANASDADGTISKVEFLQGATKLGEKTTAPYTYNWANAPIGTHKLSARATDNKGAVTISAAVTIQVISATSGTGKITREYWGNIGGNSISNIPVTTNPTSVSELTLFEAPTNIGDNYGQRVRGYVTAPVSGKYTFWIAGDNDFELWLSTSEDPAKKRKIAYMYNGWTNPREWTKYRTQKSARITLEAGKRYYIEALMKEEYGGDNLAVGWQLPNGTLERPIAGNRLSPFLLQATSTSVAQAGDEAASRISKASVYPNPFRDAVTVDLGTEGITLQEAVLLNQSGQKVYMASDLQQENNRLVLNLARANLNPGLYFLKYTDTAGKSHVVKLIKD